MDGKLRTHALLEGFQEDLREENNSHQVQGEGQLSQSGKLDEVGLEIHLTNDEGLAL